MMEVEYSREQDKWLLCLKLAQSFFTGDEARAKANIIFMRSELLPLWSIVEIFEELQENSESF